MRWVLLAVFALMPLTAKADPATEIAQDYGDRIDCIAFLGALIDHFTPLGDQGRVDFYADARRNIYRHATIDASFVYQIEEAQVESILDGAVREKKIYYAAEIYRRLQPTSRFDSPTASI